MQILKKAFFACAGLMLFSCSASLSMRQAPTALPNDLAKLKTVAYAEVNSPKQSGEIYLSKASTAFTQEEGIWKMTLDPQSFHNAYSFLEVSVGAISPKGLSKVQILLQGENFSDGYRTKDLSGEKSARFECDGETAIWSYQGLAQSAISNMPEAVDLKLVFTLPTEMKVACHP